MMIRMGLAILLSLWLSWAEAVTLQPFTVLLDWFVNPDHAPLIIAQQQGFFKQQGLEVKLISPADPSDPPKLVAAQKADIAITYQPRFLVQVSRGLPLVRVASLIDSPLNCIAVLASSDIHQPRDFKAKRLGYSTAGVDGALLATMLHSQGLTLNDVERINVHYNLVQALLSHQVDIAAGLMRNVEVPQLALAGYPARTFYPEDYGVPSYDELIFVTHQSMAHSDKTQRFIKALQQGVDYLQQHPEASWQILIKQHPELNNPLNRHIWLKTLPLFAKQPQAFDLQRYQRFATFMQNQGLIEKLPAIESYT